MAAALRSTRECKSAFFLFVLSFGFHLVVLRKLVFVCVCQRNWQESEKEKCDNDSSMFAIAVVCIWMLVQSTVRQVFCMCGSVASVLERQGLGGKKQKLCTNLGIALGLKLCPSHVVGACGQSLHTLLMLLHMYVFFLFLHINGIYSASERSKHLWFIAPRLAFKVVWHGAYTLSSFVQEKSLVEAVKTREEIVG